VSGGGEIREVVAGDRIIAFVGRVVEIFSGSGTAASLRLHATRMRVKVQPTWADRPQVELRQERRGNRAAFEVRQEGRPAFEALMADGRSAIASPGGDRTGEEETF
jgi:hypothetical protein